MSFHLTWPTSKPYDPVSLGISVILLRKFPSVFTTSTVIPAKWSPTLSHFPKIELSDFGRDELAEFVEAALCSDEDDDDVGVGAGGCEQDAKNVLANRVKIVVTKKIFLFIENLLLEVDRLWHVFSAEHRINRAASLHTSYSATESGYG